MKNHKINDEIETTKVFLVTDTQNGEMFTEDALKLAEMADLDLVQMSVNDKGISVCKLIDYSKYKYEQSKKNRIAKAKARETRVLVKEIQMRPATDVNDIKIKANKARKFLDQGHKVRVVVAFKGREVAHQEVGEQVLKKFLKECQTYEVDQAIQKAGRQVIITIKAKAGETK